MINFLNDEKYIIKIFNHVNVFSNLFVWWFLNRNKQNFENQLHLVTLYYLIKKILKIP